MDSLVNYLSGGRSKTTIRVLSVFIDGPISRDRTELPEHRVAYCFSAQFTISPFLYNAVAVTGGRYVGGRRQYTT